jgi:hypothetical protein
MEQNGKGKWIRRSERERCALVSRFERSGLEAVAFCQREVRISRHRGRVFQRITDGISD